MHRIFASIALVALWLTVVQAQQPASPSTSDMASVWTDPATGLMWTKNDNGSGVNWNQANAYCTNLRLDAYSDWRLPTIDELEGIYDTSVNIPVVWPNGASAVFHVKGNLGLSGNTWSSSQGNAAGEFWDFSFRNRMRLSYHPYYGSNGHSALCVRRSGK
jgi:hypothetical protein